MKKFGVYNYIGNSKNKEQDNSLPINLLLNLMNGNNANSQNNEEVNNYYQNEQNPNETQNKDNSEENNLNKQTAPQILQKEYDPRSDSYINLYPHHKE
ncbi:MAG: hypothetical protein PHC46_00755 [Clostridia bacterium]|nr:hypothetical protein [Clostridia bacterium]